MGTKVVKIYEEEHGDDCDGARHGFDTLGMDETSK